jgi:hypothetical protein
MDFLSSYGVPILTVVGLIILYFVSFMLNKKVEAPEGCVLDPEQASCSVCHLSGSCSIKR